MTHQQQQSEFSIINKKLKDLTWGNLITIIFCTITWVATAMGIYHGFREEQALLKLEIKVLNQRVDRLENAIMKPVATSYTKTQID